MRVPPDQSCTECAAAAMAASARGVRSSMVMRVSLVAKRNASTRRVFRARVWAKWSRVRE